MTSLFRSNNSITKLHMHGWQTGLFRLLESEKSQAGRQLEITEPNCPAPAGPPGADCAVQHSVRWVSSTSKDGDPSSSLRNPFQCLTTLSVKKVFPCVLMEAHVPVCAHCLPPGTLLRRTCPNFTSSYQVFFMH